MPCTGQPISSASISCLDYFVAWDISGAQPVVTLTNNSTVVTAANLSWWFYITSPSGIAIYGVDLSTLVSYPTADVVGATWTTKTFNLPTPFGTPPCGQIEWSGNSPYTVKVFVVDSAAPSVLNNYSKTALLVRPGGNTQDTCGNFGQAAVSVQVDCQNKNIQCLDSTTLVYNNILATAPTSNAWTLVYPQDETGNIPNRTAVNTPSVDFPVSVNSDGYTLYLQEYVTYDYGNGVTVIVQYKLYNTSGGLGLTFAVACNTNLCQLQCQMQKVYELSKQPCGTVENANITNTMVRLNFLFSQILTGIFQPLCGINVAALIAEMKKVGKFDDNCDCGCGSGNSNFGFSNSSSSGNSPCCPITVPVYAQGTTAAPSTCPNSYFPANVYAPDGTTLIGIAYTMDDEISILNSNILWQTYGTFFSEGNCKVGVFPLNGGIAVPPIVVLPVPPTGGGSTTCTPLGTQLYAAIITNSCGSAPITSSSYPFVANVNFGAGPVSLGSVSSDTALIAALNATSTKPPQVTFSAGSVSGTLTVVVNNTSCASFDTTIVITGCLEDTSSGNLLINIYDRNTLHPPTACPGSFYPTTVWSVDNTAPIGIASTADDLVAILNSNAGWEAIGIFSNGGNCQVVVTVPDVSVTLPFVPVGVVAGGGSGCVDNTQIYQISLTDYCLGTPVTTLSYPFFGFVNYGSGLIPLGEISSLAALLTALNTNSAKPTPLTFTNGTSGVQLQVNVLNTDCTTYTMPTTVYADTGTGKQYIAMGGNHHNFAINGGSFDFFGVTGNQTLGKICQYPANPTERPFHTIKVGNYTYTTEPTTGKIYVAYVGSPLTPAIVNVIQLNTIVSGGSGNFTGNPATYGEQSFYGLYFPTAYITPGTTTIYVVESITGTIWSIDTTTNTVTGGFHDSRLLGKCPRVLWNVGAGKNFLYFTQDGHIEQDASLSSGVPIGDIVVLDGSNFTSGGLSVVNISASSQYIVAMDFDGTNILYITGDRGDIYVVTIGGGGLAVVAYAIRWAATFTSRWSNLKLANNRLYLSNYSTGTRWLNVADITDSVAPTAFAALNPTSGGANNLLHYNFLPMSGACFGLLTYYQAGSGTTTSPAGIAKFTNDGIFVSLMDVPVGDLYNVILIDFITSTPTVYTPNLYCALP